MAKSNEMCKKVSIPLLYIESNIDTNSDLNLKDKHAHKKLMDGLCNVFVCIDVLFHLISTQQHIIYQYFESITHC